MNIEEIEKQIIAEFSLYDDWLDKYNFLIEMSRSLPVIDQRLKTEENLIHGCQSRVWLHAEYREGMVFFTADSDAVITKGIVSLLIRALSGQPPDAILNASTDFIDQIGLKEHLSPTRSNGLQAMLKQMRLYALAFKVKYQQYEQ